MFIAKNCKECCYFKVTKEIEGREDNIVGLCRYNPPSIMEPQSPGRKMTNSQ